jgi:hypothetical protein
VGGTHHRVTAEHILGGLLDHEGGREAEHVVLDQLLWTRRQLVLHATKHSLHLT